MRGSCKKCQDCTWKNELETFDGLCYDCHTPKYIKEAPTFGWLRYKNEIYYGTLNYDRSMRARRVMVDLAYCATRSLNDIIDMTVMYNPSKFIIGEAFSFSNIGTTQKPD